MELHLLILNGNLRDSDSEMLNFYTKHADQCSRLQVLFSTEFNQFKREFDVQQGLNLQRSSEVVVTYCAKLSAFAKSLKSLKIKELLVYSQDLPYNLTIVRKVFSLFPASQVSVEYPKQGEISESSSRCRGFLFRDYLCSDLETYKHTNLYSAFNRKFIARELYSVRNKHVLKEVSSDHKTLAKQLGLEPISQAKRGETEYPEQAEVWRAFCRHLINYSEGRQRFGSLFDFEKASSSFQSPFLSSGVISTAQLLRVVDLKEPSGQMIGLVRKASEKFKDPETQTPYSLTRLKENVAKYRDEVLWAEFCHLYWINNQKTLTTNGMLNTGGLYNRKRKWVANPKLLHDFEYGLLDNDQFSLINAAMNQLRLQGYMSNYLRMITASFCLQQHLDWRDCLGIFEKYLIDINFASNLYGWLWSYNLTNSMPRIFSVSRQTQKRDKDHEYRKKWLKDAKSIKK